MIAAWHDAPTSISAADAQGVASVASASSSTSPRMLPMPNSAVTSAHDRAPSYSWQHQHRPDHEDRRQHDRVVDAEAAEEAEHPRARAHLAPALAQRGAERRRGGGRVLLGERLGRRRAGRSGSSRTTEHRERRGVEDAARCPGRRRTRSGGRRRTGPTTLPSENVRPRRALAGWMLAGVTVVGSRPLNAGAKNASAAPKTAASTTSWPTRALAGEQQDRGDRLGDQPDRVGR